MRAESLISGFGPFTRIISYGFIGKDTFEPVVRSIPRAIWINLFIWLTMQCKNIQNNMGNINPPIRYLLTKWTDIVRNFTITMDFIVKSTLKLRIWLKYYLRLVCWWLGGIHNNLNCLVWIFWLTNSLMCGWLSATPILALRFAVLCWTDWCPICYRICWL